MNPRKSLLALLVLPPLAVFAIGVVLTAPALRAQFDLGRLKRGIEQAKSTTQKVT